ncbi:YkvI family membrane protein [Microtetraspora glauca]|uniref:Membrane protein YkvI n=1 Tax=Microtetraspora glauca TaxID=1996 RepID=A0ABV3GUE1_MICGL
MATSSSSPNDAGRAGAGLRGVLVPALMFQAVAIGGAYATGREIIEFGAGHGALGWAAGLAMAITGSLLSYLVYEMARRHRLFDYRSLLRHLINKLYWLFDAVYIPLAIAIIAVLASATGNILKDTLGLNYWAGVAVIIVVTGFVTFRGTEVVERFNGIGTILLTVGYIVFALLVIPSHWERIGQVMSAGDHSLRPGATFWDAALLGMTYVGMGFVVFPSTLMTVRHLRSRRDAAKAAALTGGLYVVPWFLTYAALMGFYPDPKIFDAPVPWLKMLEGKGTWVVVVYGLLVGWTLVATAVGLIQAIVLRVDQNLVDAGRPVMTSRVRVGITLAVLLLGAALAQFGIIDLIAVGYLVGAVALILVFGVPLIARGAKLFLPRSDVPVVTQGQEPAAES